MHGWQRLRQGSHSMPPGHSGSPAALWGKRWRRMMDSERGFVDKDGDGESFEAGTELDVAARSLWLLRRVS